MNKGKRKNKAHVAAEALGITKTHRADPAATFTAPPPDEVSADVEQNGERVVLTLAMPRGYLRSLRVALMAYNGEGWRQDQPEKMHNIIAEACDDAGVVLE